MPSASTNASRTASKNEKSTSGWAERRSANANAVKRRTAATSRLTIAADPQPQVDPWISASVSADRGERRAAREQPSADEQNEATAVDVGEPARRDQQRRERDVERGHRPLELFDRGAELAVDRRQGDDDRSRRQLHDPGRRDGSGQVWPRLTCLPSATCMRQSVRP
jgi:hypothetical protein